MRPPGCCAILSGRSFTLYFSRKANFRTQEVLTQTLQEINDFISEKFESILQILPNRLVAVVNTQASDVQNILVL
jgi:hypothetical protein